jgi:hypothetical protein
LADTWRGPDAEVGNTFLSQCLLVKAMAVPHIESSPIPPFEQSIYFFLLRWVIQDLKQTDVEPFRIRDGIRAGEDRG